jgi:predicted ArsR family transcriptional regulator
MLSGVKHLAKIEKMGDPIERAQAAIAARDEALNILCEAVAALADGMSYQQIAEALDISKNWARQLHLVAQGEPPLAGRPLPAWRRQREETAPT